MATNNWWFVGAAFAVTWVMFVGYFVHLRRASRRARTLLESVQQGNIR